MYYLSIRYLFKSFLLTCLLTAVYVYAGNSDIIDLTQKRDVVGLKNILSKRFVNLEKRDKNGDTALLIAARNSQWDIFDILVKQGANINVLAANNRDILNLSVRISNPELAVRAIKAGISTHTFTPRYQGSALIFAAAEGEFKIVDALINGKAPLNRRNNLGWTALLEAVILGDGSEPYQQIVERLLEAGANRNITDKLGKTPLYHAQQKGYDKMIELFMFTQAD